MQKVLFLVNPCAGKGMVAKSLLPILRVFSEHDFLTTTHITRSRGDASAMARRYGGEYALVVCSGGDGTLDEVVSGLAEGGHTTPVGYLPAGSTNDFAHSLRLPADMEQAAEIVVQQRPFACDLGRFNREHFVYVAAFGLFTAVSYKTAQDMKNLLGRLAYLLEGARDLLDTRVYPMTVTVDGERIEGDFIYGMISNSESVGGIRGMAGKNVQLDDGLFEVLLVRKPETLADRQALLTALTAQQSDEPMVYYRKAHRITVQSEQEVPWTLDGENGGAHRQVEIRNEQKRIQIMVGEALLADACG